MLFFMRILNALLTVVVALFFTTACTSNVVKSLQSKQEVLLESVPSNSDIYIDGEFIGKTPMVLNLRSDISHEIYFQKEGFKSANEYLNPVFKHEKRPFVQFGLAKDLGYYYVLSKDSVLAELYWEPLPDTAGIEPFETMSQLIAKADNALSVGDLTADEHKIIMRQIVELFNSN